MLLMMVHWFELRRWSVATAPARKPSGYSEEYLPHPHLQELRRVKCGRRRKWRSGSESKDHRKIARRANGGMTLIGVLCSVSRVVGAGNQTRKFVWREAIRNKTVELMRKGLLVITVGLKCFRANRFKSFKDPFW